MPLQITVTTQSGDPDLFVSVLTQTPSATNSSWRSVTGNGQDELVTMYPTDPDYPATVPFDAYISVYAHGYVNASFTINAKLIGSANATTPLLDGMAAAGVSAPHAFSYYSFGLSSAAGGAMAVDFVVTPRIGDVDLYISNITGAGGAMVFPQVCRLVGACMHWAMVYPQMC